MIFPPEIMARQEAFKAGRQGVDDPKLLQRIINELDGPTIYDQLVEERES